MTFELWKNGSHNQPQALLARFTFDGKTVKPEIFDYSMLVSINVEGVYSAQEGRAVFPKDGIAFMKAILMRYQNSTTVTTVCS